VGQKKLHLAIAQYSASVAEGTASAPPVRVVWKPYQIDPTALVEGEDFDSYALRRWGGPGKLDVFKSAGSPVGATFSNWKWRPNTLLAHQWIQYGVQEHNADTDHCNASLFRAQYEEGQNISLVDTLVDMGRTEFPNCNEAALRDYLQGNQGKEFVQNEMADYRRRYRIDGVPFFIINVEGRKNPPYCNSGAQSPNTLVQIFEELAQE
jgi:predicted DsbA family dithiol-disulfide isomerase